MSSTSYITKIPTKLKKTNYVPKIIMLFLPAIGPFEACRVIGADGPGLTKNEQRNKIRNNYDNNQNGSKDSVRKEGNIECLKENP